MIRLLAYYMISESPFHLAYSNPNTHRTAFPHSQHNTEIWISQFLFLFSSEIWGWFEAAVNEGFFSSQSPTASSPHVLCRTLMLSCVKNIDVKSSQKKKNNNLGYVINSRTKLLKIMFLKEGPFCCFCSVALQYICKWNDFWWEKHCIYE